MTLKFTAHAIRRMRKWRLSDDDVLHILAMGAVIEAYPSDAPFPSRLVLARLYRDSEAFFSASRIV